MREESHRVGDCQVRERTSHLPLLTHNDAASGPYMIAYTHSAHPGVIFLFDSFRVHYYDAGT
jgi:hypothetical protein